MEYIVYSFAEARAALESAHQGDNIMCVDFPRMHGVNSCQEQRYFNALISITSRRLGITLSRADEAFENKWLNDGLCNFQEISKVLQTEHMFHNAITAMNGETIEFTAMNGETIDILINDAARRSDIPFLEQISECQAKKRPCMNPDCHGILDFNGFFWTNHVYYSIDYLMATWLDDLFGFFCCDCFDEYNNKVLHEMKWANK